MCTQAFALQSPFGPHKPPPKGPWFEGWYVRVTDAKEHRSFAVIATSQLKPKEQSRFGVGSSGYLSVITQDGEGRPTKSFESYPEKTFIKVKGQPLTNYKNEDNSEFSWEAPNHGWLTPEGFDLRIPGKVEAKARLRGGKPWSQSWSKWGPEGYGSFMPFITLHWFVHSLSSAAEYFLRIVDEKSGDQVYQSSGTAHFEKNWGKSFPKAWMWLQADDAEKGASLALAGGILVIGPVAMKTYLAGYKSTKVDAEFQMGQLMDMSFSDQINPEKGTFQIRLENGEHTMIVKAKADPKSFATVSIPTENGYMPNGGIESFSTEIIVEIHNNNWIRDFVSANSLIEKKVFRKGAIEFGGAYMRK
jgi:hypothetical protein